MMHEEHARRTGNRSYWTLGGATILSLLVGLGIGMAVAGEAEAETEITLPAAVQEAHDDGMAVAGEAEAETENTLPADVQEVHNKWYAAWNEADGETAKSMMAPFGRHYCPGSGRDGVSGEDLAAFVNKGFSVSDLEIIGSISMPTPGEGQSQDHVVVTQHTLDGHEGYVSILHLRGQADSLKILSHRAFP